MEINQWIVREILKSHFEPYHEGVIYNAFVLNDSHLRISFTDRTGDIMGSFEYRHLDIRDVYNHPVVLQYNRDLRINQIEK